MPASISSASPNPAALPTRARPTLILHVDDTRRLLHTGRGPSFTQVQVKTDDVSRVLPIRDGHEIKRRFMAALTAP